MRLTTAIQVNLTTTVGKKTKDTLGILVMQVVFSLVVPVGSVSERFAKSPALDGNVNGNAGADSYTLESRIEGRPAITRDVSNSTKIAGAPLPPCRTSDLATRYFP